MNYGQTARQAYASLKAAGAPVTVSWAVEPDYVPGVPSEPTLVSVTTYGAVLPYPSHKIGTQPDSTIRAGDRWLLLAAIDDKGAAVPAIPPDAVAVLASGERLKVANAEPLAPAGVTVLYDITLRRS